MVFDALTVKGAATRCKIQIHSDDHLALIIVWIILALLFLSQLGHCACGA